MIPFRISALGMAATLLLSACSNAPGLDWDLRGGSGALDTSSSVAGFAGARPGADARGVISYPNYQVAVARRGDTVASVAARVGINPGELARFNALSPENTLREGEVLALPGGAAAAGGGFQGGVTGGVIGGGAAPVDVTAIATTALDRVGTQSAPPPPPPGTLRDPARDPVRHKVARGETAFTIARTYGVSAKTLAEWNGLGPDLAVREGQFLVIPASSAPPPAALPDATPPGTGSPTPEPPSAKKPLPEEKTERADAKPKATPPSPELGNDRTKASSARFAMPVDGKIIRGYSKKTDGIDIAAAPGTPVKAAADGTVAAITKDTGGKVIVVLSHAGGILTVYAGVDGVTLAKGAKVKRGQQIARLPAGDNAFVHFEVRKGVDSEDPLPYLQ